MYHDKYFLLWLCLCPIAVNAAMESNMPPLPAPFPKVDAADGSNNSVAGIMRRQQERLKRSNGNHENAELTATQSKLKSAADARQKQENPAPAAATVPPAAPGPLQTQTINPLQTPSPALTNVVRNANLDAVDDAEAKKKYRERIFSDVKDDAVPLSPQQIHDLRRLLDSTQRAVATPPAAPPKPVSSSLVINLSPGVTPPVIRLAAGYVSSLVFVDVTGAPWPIVSYGLGNPEVFNIQWDQKSNLLMLQSVKNYATGNLAVRLFGNPTPIMLSLVTSQKEVDYRVDLQVQGRGPHANAEIMVNTLPEKANPILISLLDGVPPKDSRLLQVDGDQGGRAWLKDGKLYYRSSVTILSPAWHAFMTSADGTKVYEMNKTPLLLASRDGTTIQIKLSGF